MAPRKLPPGEKQIHVGVSMPPDTWATAQLLGKRRGVSASAILREAMAEYLDRRLGGPETQPEPLSA